MNATEMLDYTLGQVEGPDLDRLEREFAADPFAAERIDRLSRSIHHLLDDGWEIEPPIGLADRTMRVVAEGRRRRSVLEFVPARVPFRWADVAVAAGIFIAGLLTLMPALTRSRDRMDQAGCMYNLQRLGSALWQYGSIHHHYPAGPEDHPSAPTGTFAVMLNDSGVLADPNSLICPSKSHKKDHLPLPDMNTICRLTDIDPNSCVQMVHSDYAYNVGYRTPSGELRPIAAVHTSLHPLLADQPAHDGFPHIYPGNSPNHGGQGQNVLYSDLHVGWHNTRRLGPHDADMFLNERQEPAPGVHAADTALLPSRFPFRSGR
jgi:hypothetical protein